MSVIEKIPLINVPAIPSVDTRGLAKLDLDTLSARYGDAQPFPHIVLDGLFPAEVLRAVLAEIQTGNETLEKEDYASVQKHRISDVSRLGPASRRLIDELNSAPFLGFLEKVTGIQGLVPDPHLEGGGIHQIAPGGFLKVHTDFNWHHTLKLHRRINILLYLNENWSEEWNGHLELWDENLEKCGAKIAPIFNRMVIFSTTDKSYHGHPDVLCCPDNVRRNSIALYYYTASRPASEAGFGKSIMTNYRERPGEAFEGGKLKHRVHQTMIRLPVLQKVLRSQMLRKALTAVRRGRS